MSGLGSDTIGFLADLSNNNNREWFLENRNRYEQAQNDFQQLVFSLIVGIITFR